MKQGAVIVEARRSPGVKKRLGIMVQSSYIAALFDACKATVAVRLNREGLVGGKDLYDKRERLARLRD